jgi:hypothetical protein
MLSAGSERWTLLRPGGAIANVSASAGMGAIYAGFARCF